MNEGEGTAIERRIRTRSAGASDVGLRTSNQDAWSISEEPRAALYLVADGMGGHDGGEVASVVAVEAARKEWLASDDPLGTGLQELHRAANRAVRRERRRLLHSRMGTTLVALALDGERAGVSHIGDSRVYRVRDGEIQRMTVDHTEAQEMCERGELTPEQADRHRRSNYLTRAIGTEEAVRADVHIFPVMKDDIFVLCSDGLSGVVADIELSEVVRYHSVDDAARLLVELANHYRGGDNITTIVVRVGEDERPVEEAPDDYVLFRTDVPPTLTG